TDSPETLNLSLSAPSVAEGTAAVVAGQGSADLHLTDIDAAVTFQVTVSSEGAGNDASSQSATIGEETPADDQGQFQIQMNGFPLSGSNTASVTVAIGGDTENGAGGDFTQAVASAIQAGAAAAGVGFVDNGNGTVTLTWSAASTSQTVLVDLAAVNDDLTDSPETLNLSLSAPSVAEGTAAVVAGQGSADLHLTDIDAAVTFQVTVSSEGAGND